MAHGKRHQRSTTHRPLTAVAPPTPTPAPKPLMDAVWDTLAAPALATEDGPAHPPGTTNQQAILNALVGQASKADTRAAQMLFTLKRELDEARQEEMPQAELEAEDEAVFENLTGQIEQKVRRELGVEPGTGGEA